MKARREVFVKETYSTPELKDEYYRYIFKEAEVEREYQKSLGGFSMRWFIIEMLIEIIYLFNIISSTNNGLYFRLIFYSSTGVVIFISLVSTAVYIICTNFKIKTAMAYFKYALLSSYLFAYTLLINYEIIEKHELVDIYLLKILYYGFICQFFIFKIYRISCIIFLVTLIVWQVELASVAFSLLNKDKEEIKLLLFLPELLIPLFVILTNYFIKSLDLHKRKVFIKSNENEKLNNFLEEFIDDLEFGVLSLKKDNFVTFNKMFLSKVREFLFHNGKNMRFSTNDHLLQIQDPTSSELHFGSIVLYLDKLLLVDEKSNESLFSILNKMFSKTAFESVSFLDIGLFRISKIPINKNRTEEDFENFKISVRRRFNTDTKSTVIDIIFKEVIDVRKSERMKSESNIKQMLFSKISHEFKTPLITITNITSELSLLLNSNELNRKNFICNLENIEKLSQYLIYLVDDVILYSSSGKLLSESHEIKHKIDLKDILTFSYLVCRCLLSVGTGIKDNVETRFEYSQELDYLEIYSNKIHLTQILMNIISNAVKFTKIGFVSISAYLKRAEQNMICIAIEDTGRGIEEGALENIRKSFKSKKTDLDIKINHRQGNYQDEGPGLGLGVVNSIANKLSHRIEINSKLDVGTVFEIYISDFKYNEKWNERDSEKETLKENIVNDSRVKNFLKKKNKSTRDKVNTKRSLKQVYFNDNPEYREKSERFLCKSQSKKSIGESLANGKFSTRSLELSNFSNVVVCKNCFLKDNESNRKKPYPEDIELNLDEFPIYHTDPLNSKSYNSEILDDKREEIFYKDFSGSSFSYRINEVASIKNSHESEIAITCKENQEPKHSNSAIVREKMRSDIFHESDEDSSEFEKKDRVNSLISSSNVMTLRNFNSLSRNSPIAMKRKYQSSVNIFKSIRKKPKILIVDDSLNIRKSMLRILKSINNVEERYTIVECRDGIEILKEMMEDQFSGNLIKLVLTDENMEFMSGSEAVRILKKLESNNKIKSCKYFSVTALIGNEAVSSIQSVGFDEIISKPITKQKVESILRDFE